MEPPARFELGGGGNCRWAGFSSPASGAMGPFEGMTRCVPCLCGAAALMVLSEAIAKWWCTHGLPNAIATVSYECSSSTVIQTCCIIGLAW